MKSFNEKLTKEHDMGDKNPKNKVKAKKQVKK